MSEPTPALIEPVPEHAAGRHRNAEVTQAPSEPSPPPRQRKITTKRFLIGSAIVVVVLAGTSVAALELVGPHYKQPWCGTVEATLDNKSQTQGQFEAALGSEGAPVSQLLSDVQTYDNAVAAEQSSNNFGVLGAIGNAMGSVNVVGSDLRRIDRECGVPQSAAGKQGI